MEKINFKFSKQGDLIYISHLDMVRVFSRALRRANFPLYLTQGFSPRPKVAFGQALSLGKSSDNESCKVFLQERVGEEEFTERMNRQLPEGIKVLNAFYEN